MEIVKKDYDIYGNLIACISLARFQLEPDSWQYKNQKSCFEVDKIGDYEIFTSGTFYTQKFDEWNNIIEREGINYTSTPHKEITKYKYLYDDRGNILQETHFSSHIMLYNTPDDLCDKTRVNHFSHAYDNHKNLVQTVHHYFLLPSDFFGENLPLSKENITEVIEFNNLYDASNRLSRVTINEKKYNNEGKLVNNEYSRPKSEVYEYDGNNSYPCMKKVYHEGNEAEFIISYKYSQNLLEEERYINRHGVLMRIIKHEKINGRVCKKIISPLNDGLRWYIIEINNSSATVEIEEDILTPQLLESICNYILKHKGAQSPYSVYVGWLYEMDINLFQSELNIIINKNKNEHNIEIVYGL